MQTVSVTQPGILETPMTPSETSKHVFCFSHLSGVKMEQDATNGTEVSQMSH